MAKGGNSGLSAAFPVEWGDEETGCCLEQAWFPLSFSAWPTLPSLVTGDGEWTTQVTGQVLGSPGMAKCTYTGCIMVAVSQASLRSVLPIINLLFESPVSFSLGLELRRKEENVTDLATTWIAFMCARSVF